jgi:hypothetical protein
MNPSAPMRGPPPPAESNLACPRRLRGRAHRACQKETRGATSVTPLRHRVGLSPALLVLATLGFALLTCLLLALSGPALASPSVTSHLVTGPLSASTPSPSAAANTTGGNGTATHVPWIWQVFLLGGSVSFAIAAGVFVLYHWMRGVSAANRPPEP